MLYQVLKYLRNFFIGSIENGTFTIDEDGALDLPNALDGQYVLIQGSVFNDGVYKTPVIGVHSETFEGTISYLKIPKDLLDIVEEIEAYCEMQKSKPSPYQSESFGGYSYSLKTDEKGASTSWIDEFSSRLSLWRKL